MLISVSEAANEAAGSWLKCLLPGLSGGCFLVCFTCYIWMTVFACLLLNTKVQVVLCPPESLSACHKHNRILAICI